MSEDKDELQELYLELGHSSWVLIPDLDGKGMVRGYRSIRIPKSAGDSEMTSDEKLLLNYWTEIKRLRGVLRQISRYDLDDNDPLAVNAVRQWALEAVVVQTT